MTHPPAGADPRRAGPPGAHDALLEGLTAEQAQAVRHGPGPLLLLAGPGAGKTKTLTHRVARLLATGLAQPWEILAVTFSVRAAGELRLRLADLLGEQQARGVTAATFHSVCARLLREHAAVFGRTDAYTVYDQADVRKVIEWLLSDAQRGRIQQALADHGQPASSEVLDEISLAKNRLLDPDSYQHTARHPAAPLIAAVWREADIELRRSNAFDFDDLLVHAVRLLAAHPHRLAFYRQRWKWLLVDEYQDTNEAQSVLVALLAGAGGNVTCVADDDQCLIAGTEITMADGTRRPIEGLRAGDQVLSAYGTGRFRAATVRGVHRARKRKGIAITTIAGRRLVSTPEHMHFAGYRRGSQRELHLTYLMWREAAGFRVGTTRIYEQAHYRGVSGLGLRCLQEHADAAWVVSVHEDEAQARYEEAVLSLRYGLPTYPFVARRCRQDTKATIVGDQAALRRLFRSVDTEPGGRRLLRDQGLSFEHPHHTPQSAAGRRRYVTVGLCDGKSGAHRLRLSSSDPVDKTRLKAAGVVVQHTRGANWRVQVQSTDMGLILEQAQRIAGLIGARLRFVARLGQPNASSQNTSLPFMPASAVRPGMALFTAEGGYDEVVAVEPVAIDRLVYDLDVERTHNYVANGIVTHNCIYSWRGARHSNVLGFAERFPGHTQIVLGRNFRCRAEILDAAVACVSHNEQRTAKALIAMRGPGGQAHAVAFGSDRDEAHWVAGQIADTLAAGVPATEVLVLARTGYATGPVQAALARAGIPHRVLGSLGLYERAEVRDALAYLALLANPADAQAFRRAVQSPRRGVGVTTANRVVALARAEHAGDLIAASARAHELAAIRQQAVRDRLARFGAALEHVRAELAHGRSVGHIVLATVMLEGGLVRHFQQRRDHSPNPDERRDAERVLEDLRSLCRAAQSYDDQQRDQATLTGFLEHAAGLHAEEVQPGEQDRRITVSTIHRAKGTEALLVVLVGCEERLLPSWRSLASPDPERLAEERRLFYVAATRAKDRLLITHAATRNRRPTGGPSRFLTEARLIDPPALAA